MVSMARGLAKLAAPTCTAVAPAMMNSSASRPVAMPPRPTTGDAHGPHGLPHHPQGDGPHRRAGEARKDVVEDRAALFQIDGAGLEGVGQADGVGAPAASTALHISGMFSAWGLSLTIRGFLQAARTIRTTSPAASDFTP